MFATVVMKRLFFICALFASFYGPLLAIDSVINLRDDPAPSFIDIANTLSREICRAPQRRSEMWQMLHCAEDVSLSFCLIKKGTPCLICRQSLFKMGLWRV